MLGKADLAECVGAGASSSLQVLAQHHCQPAPDVLAVQLSHAAHVEHGLVSGVPQRVNVCHAIASLRTIAYLNYISS